MTRTDRHDPIPLEQWIRGKVTVHFRSGHVAELRMSLRGAHSVRLQAEAGQGGDPIDGVSSHNGWVAARSEEIVLTEWTPDPDYGWRTMPPSDREHLRRLAMKHGVLGALADLWEERAGRPAYSIAEVSTLYNIAVGTDMSRNTWDEIAVMVEGTEGAKIVASVWELVLDGDDLSSRVNDAAEPDPASPTSDERGGAEDDGHATTTDTTGAESDEATIQSSSD